MSTQATGTSQHGGFLAFWTTLPGLISAVAALIAALGTTGILVATHGPEPSPTPGPPRPVSTTLDVPLVVGLRPNLGQLSEEMELSLDGATVTDWSADASNPAQTLHLDGVAAGRHRYVLSGTFTYLDPQGQTAKSVATGSGTVHIDDTTRLGIEYLGGSQFRLVDLP